MSKAAVSDVLISLDRRFVDAFVSGEKCVELRRRRPRIAHGARVWFYSKVPEGQIRAYGILKSINVLPPEKIWRRFNSCLQLSHCEFMSYLAGAENGAVLEFEAVYKIDRPIGLEEARDAIPNFQPPQFFSHIRAEGLKSVLESHASTASKIAQHQLQ